MVTPERKFIEMLQRYGRLGQMRIPADVMPLPRLPVVVWRFRDADKHLDRAILAAVARFGGAVPWRLEPGKPKGQGGINTVLAPERLFVVQAHFLAEGRIHFDAAAEILQDDPAFVEAAMGDLPRLLVHVESALRA